MMPKSPGPGAIKTLPWRYSPAASEAPPVPERGRKSKPLPTENNEAAIGETPAGSGEAGSKRSKPDPAISIWGHILPRYAHCQLSVSAREQAHTFAAEGTPETPVPWGGGVPRECREAVRPPPTPVRPPHLPCTWTSTHDFTWEGKGLAAKNNDKEKEKEHPPCPIFLHFAVEQTVPREGTYPGSESQVPAWTDGGAFSAGQRCEGRFRHPNKCPSQCSGCKSPIPCWSPAP